MKLGVVIIITLTQKKREVDTLCTSVRITQAKSHY